MRLHDLFALLYLTNLSNSEVLVVVFSNNTIKKGNLLFGNTIEMKYSSDRVFEAVQTTRCTTCFKDRLHRLTVTISRLLIGRDDMVPRKWRDGEAICFSLSHQPRDFRRNFKRNGRQAVNVIAACGSSWVLKNGEQFLWSELLSIIDDVKIFKTYVEQEL